MMEQQPTSPDVTLLDYQYAPARSAMGEAEVEAFPHVLPGWIERKQSPVHIPYRNRWRPIESDSSSVEPRFELRTDTSVVEDTEEISDEQIMAAMVSHELVVRMPPVSQFTVQLEIRSVRNAVPNPLSPEVIP